VSEPVSGGQRPQNRLIGLLAEIIVTLYLVLDGIFRPLFQPLIRWMAKLRFIIRLNEIIGSLPAYAVLALLVVPFAIAEPAKVYALYLMTSGHVIIGVAIMVAAYLVSIVVVDRIFEAGKPKLFTIPWFLKLWTWLVFNRDRMLAWLRSTYVWKRASEVKQRFRGWILAMRRA
jgi:hypothetical protein